MPRHRQTKRPGAHLRPFAWALMAAPAYAQTPDLQFPVDCILGETCMIQQVMDRDPGPGARDFRCGAQTYDGHSGTDIRLPDFAALRGDFRVLAAGPGTVLGTRNSVPDTGIDGFPEGHDCGNGVVIDHGNGWQTQYCHLAQGAVAVTTGDQVAAGDVLGTIGYSGATEFPHLHLTLRHNGVDVDPFDPSTTDTCAIDATPLWAEPLPFAPGGILSIGFADNVPTFDDIRNGTAAARALRAPDGLVLWGFFHGGRDEDIVRISITDPDGATFHTTDITLDRTQAELFRAAGRRITAPLASGDYIGTITLIRDGSPIDTATTTIPIR